MVPVPLAASRRRERGYNQSEVLAAGLARLWNLPMRDDLLSRTRATATQTRLTPGERQRNVAHAFRSLADRGSLRGLHLVLVDDVVTTAATLNACAAALHDGGVAHHRGNGSLRTVGSDSTWRGYWSYRSIIRRRLAPYTGTYFLAEGKRAAAVAQIREIRLVDDLDGEAADETVEFGIDGKSYEIDLS